MTGVRSPANPKGERSPIPFGLFAGRSTPGPVSNDLFYRTTFPGHVRLQNGSSRHPFPRPFLFCSGIGPARTLIPNEQFAGSFACKSLILMIDACTRGERLHWS